MGRTVMEALDPVKAPPRPATMILYGIVRPSTENPIKKLQIRKATPCTVPDAQDENVLPIKRLKAPPAASPAHVLAGCTFLNKSFEAVLDAAATAAHRVREAAAQREQQAARTQMPDQSQGSKFGSEIASGETNIQTERAKESELP